MTVATLAQVLDVAQSEGYALGGMVVLGWEDVVAYVEAAEEICSPLILQAGPGCRAYMPTPILGKMFRHVAEQASVPIVCHLDHAYTEDECRSALDSGFTSVMIDGSSLPIAENIAITSRIAAIAQGFGASVEGEVGYVGYDAGQTSATTDIGEVIAFDRDSGADAIAVSIGNVHLKQDATTFIDWETLRAIEVATRHPLVLHGGSGISVADRRVLAKDSRVCKINIGTEFRMAFGAALRQSLSSQANEFDRIKLLGRTVPTLRATAVSVMTNLLSAGRHEG